MSLLLDPRLIVVVFTLLCSAPFLNKAYHMDEPVFLVTARHLLADPWHPGLFEFNWYGTAMTMTQVNSNPPLLAYLLAPVLAATRASEGWTRAAFLPFDILAALSLFSLASRFLKRPLLPVLLILACPAWLINMQHVMAEKPALAFGLAGLAALVRGVERDSRAWERCAMAALCLAALSKFGAALFLVPAAVVLLRSGRTAERTVAFCGWTLVPVFAALLLLDMAGLGGASASLAVLRKARESWDWPHRLRSLLAFVGGCGLVTAAWPFAAARAPVRTAAACLAAASLVMLPAFDIEPVRFVDRLTGLVLAGGALACLAAMVSRDMRRLAGWPLWASWAAAAAGLQLAVYWGILARIVLFVIPPLVLALSELLEARLARPVLRRLQLASLVLALPLSLCLALVDRRYADGQRAFARDVVAPATARGRTVWYLGHWGLQWYMEKAGAKQIDESRGGHEAARPGDMLLITKVNSNSSILGGPRLVRDHVVATERDEELASPIPLRLISGWRGQGGFYADSWGFLPFSLSNEPVDEFMFGERL